MLLFGCDFGRASTEASDGPLLRLIASYPENGAGLECGPGADDDCGVPLAAEIELRFDRYLLPSTVARQSISVTTGELSAFLRPRYDPVERVVVFRFLEGGLWTPGTRYTVELYDPTTHAEHWGFRAFDGAVLTEDSPAPLRFTFRTRRAFPSAPLPELPAPALSEVTDVVSDRSCTAGGCHAQPEPPMGLALDSPHGFEATLDTVAHETENGPTAAEPLENARRLGIQMPLVDRGRPGNSYLLYKVLVNPANYRGSCETIHRVRLDGCVTFPSEAAARLRAAFVWGEPMPFDTNETPSLDVDGLRLLSDWIARGAPVDHEEE